MNYIKEINAFYQIQETNQLSAAAANVWHVLLHVNNRTGWLPEFTVAMSGICFKANVSMSTFRRVRAELVEKGYVTFRSRGGNLSAMYRLVSLDEKLRGLGSGQEAASQREVSDLQVTVNNKVSNKAGGKVSTLVKRNQTKQKRDSAITEAMAFFKDNISKLTPMIEDAIETWIKRLNKDLVLCAMQRAVEHAKLSWGYVKAILTSWEKKGFQTVVDVETEKVAFKQRWHMKTKQSRRTTSCEVIPDWFNKRGEGEATSECDTATEAFERAELAQLIEQFS